MQKPGNWDIGSPAGSSVGSLPSTGPSFFPSKKTQPTYQPGIQSVSSGYPSFAPAYSAPVPYQGVSFAPQTAPSFAPPRSLAAEPPPLVNQYGRYQSIYGWPPVWGPELVPPQPSGQGFGEYDQFPDVDKNWPRMPNAEIPRDWMWYRKAKTPLDLKKDWEPTIYLDTLTLQPTTRTGMLDRATDDMLDAFDINIEKARQQAQEFEEDNAFGDLEKGMEVMEHDFEEAMTGEGNSSSDAMHRHRAPLTEMGHVTRHGRHFMRLESKAKREKRWNHFQGVAPQPVDTYIGTLWKAQNPLCAHNDGIQFG